MQKKKINEKLHGYLETPLSVTEKEYCISAECCIWGLPFRHYHIYFMGKTARVGVSLSSGGSKTHLMSSNQPEGAESCNLKATLELV